MWSPLSEIRNAANYSDHALRKSFPPHAHSTFLRIREIVQRARDDDGEGASDCENDLVRGNRCDASPRSLAPQLSPARFQPAQTMPTTEPAQSPSFSSRRIATRLLIQMEVVPVAACCRARKPPDRPRALFPAAAAAVSFSSLYPSNAPPSHSLRSLLLLVLLFLVPSLLLKCELNAFSLQSRRPTDRQRE